MECDCYALAVSEGLQHGQRRDYLRLSNLDQPADVALFERIRGPRETSGSFASVYLSCQVLPTNFPTVSGL